MKVIDFANFAPVPAADEVRCWLDAGYTKAIIGASFPEVGNIAAAQRDICARGGMDVECYSWLLFTPDWEPVFRRGLITPVRWIDCEDPSPLGTEGTRQRIRDAIAIAGAADIYARRLWWSLYTGDWNIVAEYPNARLWDSTLNGHTTPFVPFGGFTHRHMEQYAADIDVCGIEVDISEQEDDGLSQQQYDELKGSIQGTFGFALHTAAVVGEIGRAFADHVQKTGDASDAPAIAAMNKRMDEFNERLANVGKILAP